MKKRNKGNDDLIVTEEAIEDFLQLKPAQRIRWLDEMRQFLSNVRPLHTLRGFAKGISKK